MCAARAPIVFVHQVQLEAAIRTAISQPITPAIVRRAASQTQLERVSQSLQVIRPAASTNLFLALDRYLQM
jgi:hypothetical protein